MVWVSETNEARAARLGLWMAAAGRLWMVLGLVGVLAPLASAQPPGVRPVEGLRRTLPQVHALVNARVVVAPGKELPRATVVVRDGRIEQVGPDVAVPADARVWDLAGKVVYPGFLDAYGEIDLPDVPADQGLPHWNRWVQPQRRVVEHWQRDAGRQANYRRQGITARLVAPAGGIIKGVSAVVDCSDDPAARGVLLEDFAQHVRLTVPPGGGGDLYPASPMGALTLVRQSFYDARWYREAWRFHESQTRQRTPAPERDAALESLGLHAEGQRPVMIDAPDDQYLLRADRVARELGLRMIVRGSGHEYRRLEAVRRANWPLVVPIAFPKPPEVGTPEAAAEASLEQLMHWDLAPENPARLLQAGLQVVITAHGLGDMNEFWPALRRAVARGLPADEALRALTTTPAALLGLDSQLGSIEAGKLAHLVVADGDLLAEKTRIVETWIGLHRYPIEPPSTIDLRGTWRVATADGTSWATLRVSGEARSPQAELASLPVPGPVPEAAQPPEGDKPEGEKPEGEKPTEPAQKVGLQHVRWSDLQFTASFPTEAWMTAPAPPASGDTSAVDPALRGTARWSATYVSAPSDAPAAPRLIGLVVWPDGRSLPVVATRTTTADSPAAAEPPASPAPAATDKPAEQPEEQSAAPANPAPAEEAKPAPAVRAALDVNYPLGDFGRSAPPEQPAWLLFRQATVWTCGDAGVLAQADVLVHRGIILRVAPAIDERPEGVVVVEAKGLHLTPGIIDCHSHMATDGGINEGTQAITAEVRIGDFIDATDISIYRQLAGGVTAANILHGSANPIGGQSQVVKLRWGALPEEMKFQEAPGGIKFALGENVKQSNWGERFQSRYPQSRMGVEQLVRDAMLAARQYRDRQRAWERHREGLPPRRDLELDALVEVLEAQRWIHCHSYRQDEILALLRTMESVGVQIGTLQHILEGYKVADAIQKHGAMASSFADWWAYKIEVYDAIPFNGAMMRDQGVVVSFNSDDPELARHLNQEAGKAVKYGGVPPEEALRFVTLNPAKQLRVDRWVGSVEPGKHADLVLWSDRPLSPYARCEQTWVDGRKYFDYASDREERSRWNAMRETLVQKALGSGQPMQDPATKPREERDRWPRVDLFCPLQAGRTDR